VGDQRRGRDLRGRAAGADHVHSLQCRPGTRLKAFPAAVLGGFGSIPGAVVGGVLIGVIESMAGFYLAQGWKDVAPYIVLLCVAAQAGRPVRPSHAQEGLEHDPEKHALGPRPDGWERFSEKIMLKQRNEMMIRFNRIII